MEKNTDLNSIANFFSEIQMLKRIKHEGWRVAGVESPDSIGEHAVISAQIAFVLAELEGADPYKCAVINLFHDNHECRIGDHHKVAARYLETKDAEREAESGQFGLLGSDIGDHILKLLSQKTERNTAEGIIAQDADWLETAIQAKLYLENGYRGASNWIDNVRAALETDSAKKILELIEKNTDFTNSWWSGLKKMTYGKLENNGIGE